MTPRHSKFNMQNHTAEHEIKSETEVDKLHGELLVRRMDELLKKTVSYVSELNLDKVSELRTLTDQSNTLTNELRNFLHALASIAIKTYENSHCNRELERVAKNICNYTYSLQRAFDEDNNYLRKELVAVLEGLGPEAHLLLEFVNDDSNEAHCSSVVGVIDDLLFAVMKTYYRNVLQIDIKTMDELMVFELALIHGFNDEIDVTTKEDDVTMFNLIKHNKHAVCQVFLGVKMIEDETDNHEGKTRAELVNMAENISEGLAALDRALRSKHQPASLKEYTKVCCRKCCYEVVELIDRFDPNDSDPKIAVNMRSLMLNVIAHQKSLADQVTDGVGHNN